MTMSACGVAVESPAATTVEDLGAARPEDPTESTESSPLRIVCDACDGQDQGQYEALKFSGRFREWLCGICRSVLLDHSDEDSGERQAPHAAGPASDRRRELTIADHNPARTDDNGITWYRPAFEGQTPPKMWGWTSDPAQAHPDYAAAATMCVLPTDVTAEDRAAILDFTNHLERKSRNRGTAQDMLLNASGGSESESGNGCSHAPDEGCYQCCSDCNYDTHMCRGCGDPYKHGHEPRCKDCEPSDAAPTTKGAS